MSNVNTFTALEALRDRGAHYVLAASDKRPLRSGWQKTPPDFEAVRQHVAKGGIVGVIPASLGAVVIDVDNGGPDGVQSVIKALKPVVPITISKTQREGGAHIWYRAPSGDTGNRKWAHDGASGDIRGSAGFVILWNATKVADALARNFDDAQPVDLDWLPHPRVNGKRGPEAVRTAKLGGRNDALNREAFLASARDEFDKDAFRDAAIEAGLPPAEVGATLASAEAAGSAKAKLQLPKDAAGLKAALDALGISCRYNVRSARVEFQSRQDKWMKTTDRFESHLRSRIAKLFQSRTGQPLWFGTESWRVLLNAVLFHVEVDPFIEWLEVLPEWDEHLRLAGWLNEVFEAERSPLVEWASRFIFLGPIWRAFKPGHKLDEMPVLIGPQGCGKSTALRWVLPSDESEWFADGLNLADDLKGRAEALLGRVLVEASEMTGCRRADLESLKAFISRTDDGSVRLAYRANPEPLPRRAIIVGTSNDDCLPNDPTGNRRFVAIRIQGGDPENLRTYLENHREHLWSEALSAYRTGAEARLPEDLFACQAMGNERFRRRDHILEDELERWLEDAPQSFTLGEAGIGCGLADSSVKLSQRDVGRLAVALRARGFDKERRRSEGRQVVLWARKNNAAAHR